ncbi:MAG: glycosyltransferase, partial [Magnetococcales bacterium]|nr:glycosyltransferase [Magnetococcales bacterium]
LAGVKGRLHVEHGRDSYDPDGTLLKYLLLRRFTFLFAQQVVGVSDDLCQWLIQRVGVPTHKVVKVTNGVDIHHFRPGETVQRGEKFTVGFVGRLWPIKSPATLVEAVAMWRLRNPQQPFCLQVVGDGPLRQELEALAQERGVAEDMEWLGWRQDVAEILPNWQALLLPSLAEGTPLTVLEAMSCGVPVIASKVGGLPAVVHHGKTGLLIPPADPAALAEAMDFYFHNPHLVHQHGLAGREWVVANHSLQGMVEFYEKFFSGIP